MKFSSRVYDALGFDIIHRCKMNVRTRHNRLGRGVRRGRDGVDDSRRSHEPMHWCLSHLDSGD